MFSPQFKTFYRVACLLVLVAAHGRAAEDHAPAFTVKYPAYMSKHDIVYLTPSADGYEGFPLGNGDLGAMLWNTKSGISVQINKSDTWDQPNDAESVMLLRSCGRLTVDETAPCYDWLYLDDFEGRLSLFGAKASLSCRTPFKTISAESFIPAGRNVFVLKYRAKGGSALGGGSVVRIGLERWGSRAFRGWYGGIFRGAETGLGHAAASIRNRDLCLEETFSGLQFAMACRVVGIDAEAGVNNSHRAEFVVRAQPVQEFTIFCAVATSHESAHPLDLAEKLLDSTIQRGLDNVAKEHDKWWADFWSQSFVHLGDDYLENLYYLHQYLMASSSRGRYPVLFNAGLWTWNHDVRQWVNPHHWNMQQAYWSVCAANHCELMKPYLETYHRLVPKAEEYAQSRGFKNAILWNDQHDLSGRMISANAPSFVNNFTPATQIGQYFWNYYLYTGDEAFLKDKAYPFLKKAAEFYLQYLAWDPAKQQYDIFPASPYECEQGNQFRNTLTDLAMIAASFRTCVRASEMLNVDAEKRDQWQKVLDHLPPYPTMADPKHGEMFVAAQDKDGKPVTLDGFGGFCANIAPVFPAGVIGLDQQGTRLFDTAVRRAQLHPVSVLAISPIAIIHARLGQGDEALARLSMSIRQLQHFPQGLWYNIDHWHIYSKSKKDSVAAQRDYIHDHSLKYENIHINSSHNPAERVSTPMQPFIQCGLEPSGILAAAVNEMLLQSYSGVIRVFSATPNDWPAAFTLRAVGGFLVTSEKASQSPPSYVRVTSLLGKECRMIHPWPEENVVVTVDGTETPVRFTSDNQVIAFSTEKGTRYLVRRVSDKNTKTGTYFTADRNTKPKQFLEATLGKARDY